MSMEEYAKQFSGMFRGEAAQKKIWRIGKGITGKTILHSMKIEASP